MKTSFFVRALAFFSLLLLLAASPSLVAQSPAHGTLTGKLLDADTQEPIPNAHVVLLRTSDNSLISSATTRADGSFRMARVPFGQYSFRTTVLGYHPNQPRVRFDARQTTVALGNVALLPLGSQLASVLKTPRLLLSVLQ
ncbi:Carboxypeptidase regulatory-like domain-containing protein [Hymenobacter daecheongensis DSM 21074]|uniref:Carboxypeptidase regulatory-like domain-containing protein n=1 Tax=Hymenobacter daecheongensis DSM 21074 TaxID=1121955 RepID=A0A1M6EE92_9BACT|nr:carboxypeptidase-like regulatory domain-containing protein [Hymenobacter daecheongensis]SHI83796.1 Carboxypeptidase regulatory-like domain-containing protein [Hymenobacter daecheongensis DSM 21074]